MIKVFNTMGMMLIGKEEINGKDRKIKQPRVMVIFQGEGGIPMIRFNELIGSPKELDITGIPCPSYIVEDSNIKQTYAQSISGLVLPGNNSDPIDIFRNKEIKPC